ncbi:hypothetical protein BKA67DRAFT_661521 [Truncatella angustata]|uniref:Cyanovirin-N domain-containing protein n=1 Tax=Truncatella angustata TaxID=152316 RepID=A0A9P8UER4_9PEZI|nr:uncharacterized protein BKA67DRAFT_661521 [Truncatella angustata]KAH6648559.1 hypothetical protein BKA67DRAFT_661521 [Truncatella angustata]KAH8198443.1 hypothetical protein TruAng_007375 [Truncatella angustata]
MKMLAIVLFLALLGLVAAQGFLGNCTWRGANLTGTFLGMYCQDDDHVHFDYKWTWHDLNRCIINNGGQLYPYETGGYAGSCRDCGIQGMGSHFFNIGCNCFDTKGDLVSSVYDLNQVLWNHDGALGCFGHEGNKTQCGPMCDPGWVPPPYSTPLPSNAKRTAEATMAPQTLI